MFRLVLLCLMVAPMIESHAAEPAAGASAAASAAPAGPVASAAASVPAKTIIPPRIATIPEPRYPAEDLLPGIEAEAEFAVSITETGSVAQVDLLRSSGFPPLDTAAAGILKQAVFTPAQDTEGRPLAMRVRVPYDFGRTPNPLERSCAGLSNEIKEFQRFHPELKRDELGSVKVLRGLILAFAMSKGNFSMNMIRGSNALTERVIDECMAQPDLTVAKALMAVLDKGKQ